MALKRVTSAGPSEDWVASCTVHPKHVDCATFYLSMSCICVYGAVIFGIGLYKNRQQCEEVVNQGNIRKDATGSNLSSSQLSSTK
jgi:hypothetical protein